MWVIIVGIEQHKQNTVEEECASSVFSDVQKLTGLNIGNWREGIGQIMFQMESFVREAKDFIGNSCCLGLAFLSNDKTKNFVGESRVVSDGASRQNTVPFYNI